MAKKKAEGGSAAKNTAKRTGKSKLAEANQVHARIAASVRTAAPEIAQALIDRAVNGDPAAAKYLFELALIFPAAVEEHPAEKEEDSLAKTLMHRLNLPEEPIKIDEDEDGKAETHASDDDGDSRVSAGVVESVKS